MKKFYVIGSSVSKSLSPIIFNYWFNKYNIKAKYGFIQTDLKNFNQTIKKILKDKSVSGLNITIPYKQKIIKHLDRVDNHSKKINAVNCVVSNRNTTGFNTDWVGYFKTIPKTKNLNKKNVILIGYGGAAFAIHYLLKQKGFKNIKIFNRTKRKIRFSRKVRYTTSLEKLYIFLNKADFIINTTPTNPIKIEHKNLIKKNTLLSDIVYSPKETSFLKQYPSNKKIYGISMLIQQAVFCFEIWFGYKPAVDEGLISKLNKKIL